jgi:AcrR family transcriptional regulator
VSDIARTAGMTTGAIYAHYANKAELLLEAIRSHGPAELADLADLEGATSILDVIERLGAKLPDRARRSSALMTEAVVAGRRDPDVRKVLRSHLVDHERMLTELATHAQASGEIDPALSASDLVRLTTLVALGSLVAGAVGMPATGDEEWKAVIHRLIDAVRPSEART